jgi:hypothetical protein
MASEFVIIKKEKADKKSETKSASELLGNWFSLIKNVPPQTVAKVKEEVRHKLESGFGRHIFEKMQPEYRLDSQFKYCLEETIREQWNDLKPEERLLIRFPSGIQGIGEKIEIPNRGTGVLIRRVLTERFGIEMVFQMQDGSFFKYEFID